ncbi:MAG: zinc-binding alcohol dehydrogenase family protein [Chloroflexi bacterium]|nr:zinc-binding alcohol dehydrogenase family protein [Chloroflexota bacterium]
MRRLVTVEPGRVAVEDGPEPVVGPDDALIGVEAVGICGSDIHLFTGEHPYSHFPNVQGHEFAGRVLSLPSSYSGHARVGDRVAVEPLLMCGECLPCRRGRGNCCLRMRTYGAQIEGGLAERIAVKASLLYPTGELSAELAALVEPMSIGLQAIARSAMTASDTTLVFGAGPIGQAILLAAADLGARVMVVDRLAARLELARRLGAEAVVDASTGDVREAVLTWTDGDGPTVVFEATGVPAVVESAIDLVASSGTVVVVGLSRQKVSMPMVDLTRKELTIVGSRNNMGQFGRAVDLVQRQPERVGLLVSHRFPLERAPEAFELAHSSPQVTEKVIIDIGVAA